MKWYLQKLVFFALFFPLTLEASVCGKALDLLIRGILKSPAKAYLATTTEFQILELEKSLARAEFENDLSQAQYFVTAVSHLKNSPDNDYWWASYNLENLSMRAYILGVKIILSKRADDGSYPPEILQAIPFFIENLPTRSDVRQKVFEREAFKQFVLTVFTASSGYAHHEHLSPNLVSRLGADLMRAIPTESEQWRKLFLDFFIFINDIPRSTRFEDGEARVLRVSAPRRLAPYTPSKRKPELESIVSMPSARGGNVRGDQVEKPAQDEPIPAGAKIIVLRRPKKDLGKLPKQDAPYQKYLEWVDQVTKFGLKYLRQDPDYNRRFREHIHTHAELAGLYSISLSRTARVFFESAGFDETGREVVKIVRFSPDHDF